MIATSKDKEASFTQNPYPYPTLIKAALPEDGNLLCTLLCAYSNVIGAEMSTNASGLVSTTRGPGFTPSEDLLLARAWVSVSSNGTDQDASCFWQTVTSVVNDAASET
jgi:hypothetical protein